MAGNGVTSAIVKALGGALKARIPGLMEVYDDFPTATQVLKYPCASIFTGAPTFNPLAPLVVRKEEVAPEDPDYEAPAEGEIAKKRVIRTIGKYVFSLQIDFWIKTKFERHTIFEKLVAAFNQDQVAPGIRLQLSDYYDEWAAYTMSGFRFSDSEESSQRSEWRVIVSVIADVRAITEKLDHTIEEIENTLETPDVIEPPEEEDDSVVDSII